MKNDSCWTGYKMVRNMKINEHTLRLCGLLNEDQDQLESFAKKRLEGAKKISNMAKEKGGVALLTHDHFRVKLPYYEKVLNGQLKAEEMKSEYKKLCVELHSYLNDIEAMDQSKFQKLVGKIEVLGELLIEKKHEN